MNSNIKTGKGIYLWIIAILVILNLSTIGTIVYHRQQFIKEHQIKPERMPRDRRPDFLREDFHRDDQFFKKHHELKRAYRNNARELSREMHKKRMELLKYLSSEDPDTNQLKEIAGEFGELHRELKLLTIDFFLETKSITTPEEQEQMFRYFYHLLEKDEQPPGQGNRPERIKRFKRHSNQKENAKQ